MNIEAFVLTVIIVFLAFAIGFAKGSETTVYNIRDKFSFYRIILMMILIVLLTSN
jgi:hypothetical protein